MTNNELKALKLFSIYTAGRFVAYELAAQQKASCRAHIMSALAGKKVPQSQSGVTVLRQTFITLSGVTGNCMAAQESNFVEWAKKQDLSRVQVIGGELKVVEI